MVTSACAQTHGFGPMSACRGPFAGLAELAQWPPKEASENQGSDSCLRHCFPELRLLLLHTLDHCHPSSELSGAGGTCVVTPGGQESCGCLRWHRGQASHALLPETFVQSQIIFRRNYVSHGTNSVPWKVHEQDIVLMKTCAQGWRARAYHTPCLHQCHQGQVTWCRSPTVPQWSYQHLLVYTLSLQLEWILVLARGARRLPCPSCDTFFRVHSKQPKHWKYGGCRA